MTFKVCKYCQVTQIQWDTEDSLFREADGRAHDRARCESIRNKAGTASSGNTNNSATTRPTPNYIQQQQQPPPQQSMATYDVAATLGKVEGLMQTLANQYAPISRELQRLSEMYNDLLEFVRAVAVTNKREQEMTDAEVQYDQDKEDGVV
jgi:hypothetical protein